MTTETAYCKNILFLLPREEKVRLLENSNLTNKERDIISFRIVDGLSIKEVCDKLAMDENAFVKAQRRAYAKLCFFLQNKEKILKLCSALRC